MTSLAVRVHGAVEKVAPITGVSIGKADVKATWRVSFAPTATEGQREAAAAAIAVFDETVPEVPAAVTPYQARRALNAAGLRETAEAAIAAAPQDIQDAWDYALSIERVSPLIASVSGALGLGESEIDQLFIAAGRV